MTISLRTLCFAFAIVGILSITARNLFFLDLEFERAKAWAVEDERNIADSITVLVGGKQFAITNFEVLHNSTGWGVGADSRVLATGFYACPPGVWVESIGDAFKEFHKQSKGPGDRKRN